MANSQQSKACRNNVKVFGLQQSGSNLLMKQPETSSLMRTIGAGISQNDLSIEHRLPLKNAGQTHHCAFHAQNRQSLAAPEREKTLETNGRKNNNRKHITYFVLAKFPTIFDDA